jgi:hypothetical protein
MPKDRRGEEIVDCQFPIADLLKAEYRNLPDGFGVTPISKSWQLAIGNWQSAMFLCRSLRSP